MRRWTSCPLLVGLQDEPIADNVCIPLYFLSQAGAPERDDGRAGGRGRGRELAWLLVVRALPPEQRGRRLLTGSAAPSWWQRFRASAKASTPGVSGEDLETSERRAESGQELVLGRRGVLVGRDALATDAECRAGSRSGRVSG